MLRIGNLETRAAAGRYTIPAEQLSRLPASVLTQLCQSMQPLPCSAYRAATKDSTALQRKDEPSSIEVLDKDAPTPFDQKSPFASFVSPTGLLKTTDIANTESKYKKWRDLGKAVNYMLTYNGTKDKSTKEVNNATRVATIALRILQTVVPQVQIAASIFKAGYSAAQLIGFAPKNITVEKKKRLNPIESPLTRSILAVGVAVSGFFAWKVGIIGFAVIKIGLDVLDLRNSIHEHGFTKEAVLIMIKTAGSIAYLALSIFDSNLVLIFTIATKLSSSFFVAYCEASQGRIPEAIAAIAIGCISNISNVESVVHSIQDNTFANEGTVEIGVQSTSTVADMRPDDKKEMLQRLKAQQAAIEEKRRRNTIQEEDELAYYKRLEQEQQRRAAAATDTC